MVWERYYIFQNGRFIPVAVGKIHNSYSTKHNVYEDGKFFCNLSYGSRYLYHNYTTIYLSTYIPVPVRYLVYPIYLGT